jgi:hypothetical protein
MGEIGKNWRGIGKIRGGKLEGFDGQTVGKRCENYEFGQGLTRKKAAGL